MVVKSFIRLVPVPVVLPVAALPDAELKVGLGLVAPPALPAHGLVLRSASQDVAVGGLDQNELAEESILQSMS